MDRRKGRSKYHGRNFVSIFETCFGSIKEVISMGKYYYCDQCGKVTAVLYDIILKDGTIISVCRECFYATPIDRVEINN
jgi:hypothetical protein